MLTFSARPSSAASAVTKRHLQPNQADVRDQLAVRWRQPDWRNTASAPALAMLGTPGEWDPPEGVTPKKETLYLSVGIPDSGTLPRAALNEAMQKVLAENSDASLRYGFGQGYFPLRTALADSYRSLHPCDISEDWYQLTNGSSGAIDLIVRSLIDPGDVILTETPVYMGTLRNFRGVGARIEAVPIDHEGLRIDALQAKLADLAREGAKVKILYTISSFQNPSGATLSLSRRHALLELAAQYGFLILDDEAYADLYYKAAPLPSLISLANGNGVITVGTFSKTVATGLRVGWIIARPEFLALFGRMRFDMGQNQMSLRMMAHFLSSGALQTHLPDMRELYQRKMTILADSLEREAQRHLSIVRPAGGFYLWARINGDLKSRDIWRTAAHEGVAVNPGQGFLPGETTEQEFLRIAFSWTPMDQLAEASRRIGVACARVSRGDIA
jgi:2-aminoadipate transaminase